MPWSGQSLDERRGIVYVATKTADPDFYGGARHGANVKVVEVPPGPRQRGPQFEQPRQFAGVSGARL